MIECEYGSEEAESCINGERSNGNHAPTVMGLDKHGVLTAVLGKHDAPTVVLDKYDVLTAVLDKQGAPTVMVGEEIWLGEQTVNDSKAVSGAQEKERRTAPGAGGKEYRAVPGAEEKEHRTAPGVEGKEEKRCKKWTIRDRIPKTGIGSLPVKFITRLAVRFIKRYFKQHVQGWWPIEIRSGTPVGYRMSPDVARYWKEASPVGYILDTTCGEVKSSVPNTQKCVSQRSMRRPLIKLKPVQLLPPLPPLRQGVIQQVIVLLSMIMLLQVALFMQQHIINAVHACLYQPGIERDQTRAVAASPACPHRLHGQGWAWNVRSFSARRAHCETFAEDLSGSRKQSLHQ